jgi:hypothetical protein
MGKVIISGVMVVLLMDNGSKTKLMVKDYMHGLMEENMLGNEKRTI